MSQVRVYNNGDQSKLVNDIYLDLQSQKKKIAENKNIKENEVKDEELILNIGTVDNIEYTITHNYNEFIKVEINFEFNFKQILEGVLRLEKKEPKYGNRNKHVFDYNLICVYNLNCKDVTFIENAVFNKITFIGIAYFSKSTFGSYSNFKYSIFSDIAFFASSQFSGYTNFSSSTFSGEADFDESIFDVNASFESLLLLGMLALEILFLVGMLILLSLFLVGMLIFLGLLLVSMLILNTLNLVVVLVF